MDYYCAACQSTAKEAREYATKEGIDPGLVIRQALSARSGHAMKDKDPRTPFNRIDTNAFKARMEIEDGSHTDPTRSTFRG